jgi:Na+-driven multidrug efflux pump
MLARVKRGNTFVCLDIRKLKNLSREVVFGILGVGIPASIQNLLNVTGSTILNNFTAVYGAAAVAAMGVSHKVNMLPMQICLGFSQGIMPLVSYNYASGNRKRMKSAILFALGIILPVMTAVTAAYWFFAPGMIRLFMDNPQIIAYGSCFLRGMCLGLVFLSVDFVAVGVFASLGMGKHSLTFAVLRKLVLEIPLLLLLNRLFPLYGLAYAQFLAEVTLAAAAVVMLLRIFREETK